MSKESFLQRLKNSWRRYKTEFQTQFKKKLDVVQDKVKSVGWYASSLKSFANLGKFIETTWSTIRDDQKEALNIALNSLTYATMAMSFLGYIINIIYNIIQTRESLIGKTKRKDAFNNTVRIIRIIVNVSLIGLSIAAVILFQAAVLILVASLKLAVKVFDLIKTLVTYRRLTLEFKTKFANLNEADLNENEIKEKKILNYALKKREWRIGARSMTIFFNLAILAIVVLSIVMANPVIVGTLILVGIASMIARQIFDAVKVRKLNVHREKKWLSVLTKKELTASYTKVLVQIKGESVYIKTPNQAIEKQQQPSAKLQKLQEEKFELEKAFIEKKWYTRMTVFDYSVLLLSAGLVIAGIILASTAIFIVVGLVTAAFFVSKFMMHIKEYDELTVQENKRPNLKKEFDDSLGKKSKNFRRGFDTIKSEVAEEENNKENHDIVMVSQPMDLTN